MNKAELKEKAEEWIKDHSGLIGSYKLVKYDYDSMQKAYIAGYEARNEEVKSLKEKVHWWKKEVNVAHRAREYEFEKLVIENKVLKRNINEVKEIIKNLCGMVRELNKPNVQLTNVDYSLSDAEKFLAD